MLREGRPLGVLLLLARLDHIAGPGRDPHLTVHQQLHLVPVLQLGLLVLSGGQDQLPPPVVQLGELVRDSAPVVELSHQVETPGSRGPLRPLDVSVVEELTAECPVTQRHLLNTSLSALDILHILSEQAKPPLDLRLVVSQVRISVQQFLYLQLGKIRC